MSPTKGSNLNATHIEEQSCLYEYEKDDNRELVR